MHPDLYKFATEAYERGEDCFYAEPVDPEEPNGNLKLCEPKYVYRLSRDITVEEYEAIFGKESSTE